MKDKESGYPLSFILTEWEYAGDWRWSWAVRPPAGHFLRRKKVTAGGRHADLSTNFLCEETGIYTDEK